MSNDKVMETFVELSVILTGFSKEVIAPSIDPVNIKALYLKTWLDHVLEESKDPELTNRILKDFNGMDVSNDQAQEQAGEALLNEQKNGEDYVLALRKLIFLWYMGAWPELHPPSDNDSGLTETRGSTSFTTLNSDSYTSGLVWKVMQAHPMGDSNYRYGYWSEVPAPLSDYTGQPNNN